jgi:hypothetical protein
MRIADPVTPKDSSFFCCERGIAALEFAFVMPVFVLILMGIIEFSLIMFTSAVLESATNNTARLGKTGYTEANMTREQLIIANIKARTTGLLDPAKIAINTEVYATFPEVGQPEPCITPSNPPCSGIAGTNYVDVNGNGQWDADMAAAGHGAAGDVVVYTASYPWPIFTPGIQLLIGNTFTISSRTVVKNEPFDSGVSR